MKLRVCLLVERSSIIRVFSAISFHTYVPPIVHLPKEPPDPINVMEDGHNTYLIKVELNI